MALLEIFGNTLREIFVVFLTILIILFGYPLVFIIFIFSWIYKQRALRLSQNDKKIRNIVEGLNGLLAGQDPYSDPLIPLIPYFFLANKLDISTVVNVLKKKIIEPNIYPELSQRIIRKFGYHFWYSVDNFKVEDHVHYLKPECPNVPITRTELNYIFTRTLGNLPFDSAKSPWEILVVPNMVVDRDPEVKSAVILRVNHCLMDGYSIANFMKKLSFKPWKMLGGEKLEEPKSKICDFVNLYKILALFFVAPYYFLKMLALSRDSNQFIKNFSSSDSEIVLNSQCTQGIQEKRLKSIKNAYGVSMSTLIITLFAEATRKYMKRAEIPLPKSIHGMFSFPLPGHGDILTNHCTAVRIPIKFNGADAAKTLRLVENEFQSLQNSVKPLVTFYLARFIAVVPLRLRPSLHSLLVPSTFYLTNFPGPTEPCDVFGCKGSYISLGGKLSYEIPFVHGCFSLAGKFWLQAAGPVSSMPNQQDADAFCESIMETLTELEAKIKRT